MDVKAAYLNAPLDCEIYIDPPKGFEDKTKNSVWKLKKSLYGLKQSGRTWNNMLHTYLIDKNFTRSPVDPCMYFKKVNNETSTILLLWVDDILIASKTEEELKIIKTSLNSRFKMTDLGRLSWFLGIKFKCKHDRIKMNQSKYIERILSKFNMENCKTQQTQHEMDLNSTMYFNTCFSVI